MKVIRTNSQTLRRDELANTLARSLHDDPFSIYLFPSNHKRLSQLSSFLLGFINYALKRGFIHVLLDDHARYQGGAVWLTPKNARINPLSFIATMVFGKTAKVFLHLGWHGMQRFNKSSSEMELAHNMQNQPHYYLMAFGIAPLHQCKGWGKKLIEPALKRAETEVVSCYLETTNKANYSFYENLNFKRTYQSNGESGPIFSCMRKDPERVFFNPIVNQGKLCSK